jgi:putative IMPACT (imprinted ancient) family translation regulator
MYNLGVLLMSKIYSVPLNEIRREQMVVNSRFIATLAPVFSIDEARTFLARIKKEFADASHNVPGYIIGGIQSLNISQMMASLREQPVSLCWRFCAAVGLGM